ncbi:hypothetical protein M2368_003430 [Arthrobacter sp. JUb119]|uniref:hypothetical protein n=1 Tax=Arthrobacter sp. JUb115 TaxID=2485108 RepID=UPI0010DD0C0A|nr:hypothetical protein [Arthrobacter sp. JUb115]MCS3494398.1 hypothetical protein [Arthrobacter sp. JUb119]TDU22491.1 hypothetical protein EDF61_10921 [Arthrobacter sp. JUb115]
MLHEILKSSILFKVESGLTLPKGFSINKQAIRKMTRDIEREFAKNPVRVPLETDPSAVSLPTATTINNYNGPVVTVQGDHAQLAWGNQNVEQTQNASEQVAPGYETLAGLLTDILASLPNFQLDSSDEDEVRSNATSVLQEVVKAEPDQGLVRRGITMVKGLLAPVASGLSKAATDETAETAREVIEALGQSLPF